MSRASTTPRRGRGRHSASRIPRGPGETHEEARSLEPIPRFSPHPPSADVEGQIEAMPMYAGESVSFVRSIEPAGQVIARIVSEAERLLAAVPRTGGAGS